MNELYSKFIKFLLVGSLADVKTLIASGIEVDALYEFDADLNRFKSTPYAVVYGICLDYFSSYGVQITQDVLQTEIKAKKLKQGKLSEYLECIEDILDADLDSNELPYLIDKVRDTHTSNKVTSAVVRVLKTMKEDGPQVAIEYAHKDFTNFLFSTHTASARTGPVTMSAFISEHLDKYNQTQTIVSPTAFYGFSKMDYKLGGLHPGEVTLLVAPPSSGKSFLAQQIFYNNCILDDKSGVYGTNEITPDQLWLRICSSQTGIPINKFLRNNLTKKELKLWFGVMEEIRDEQKDGCIIVSGEDCSTMDRFKSSVKSYFGATSPDHMIIDHINNFRKGRNQSKAESIEEIGNDIKEFAIYYNSPIISPTHLNRAGNRSDEFSLDDVQFVSLQQIVDNIIYIRQDPNDPVIAPSEENEFGSPGTLKLVMVRSRSGAIGDTWYCKADFARALITEAKDLDYGTPSVKEKYGDIE